MWALFKEILGFLGGAALVVPWLRDFLKRTGLARFMAIKAGGSLKRTLDKITAEIRTGWPLRRCWISCSLLLAFFLSP